MVDIKFKKILFADVPDSLLNYFAEIFNVANAIAVLYKSCDADPTILDFGLEFNAKEIEDGIVELPKVERRRLLQKLQNRVCFDKNIKIVVETMSKYGVSKARLYHYLLRADREKLSNYYVSLAVHTVFHLRNAIIRNRAKNSYLLIGSVDGVDRIYMACAPELEGGIQEHMYIFRDPILDLFDILSERPLVKGLALLLHLYGVKEFRPTFITTSPLKVMDELLSKQPFLKETPCPEPGCPVMNFYWKYNSKMWEVLYELLPVVASQEARR